MDLRSGKLVREPSEEMEIKFDLTEAAEIRTRESQESQESNAQEKNVMSFLENMMRKLDKNSQEAKENNNKLEEKMDKNSQEAKQDLKETANKLKESNSKVEESVNKLSAEMDKIRQDMQSQMEKKNEEIRKEISEKIEKEKKGTLNIIKDVQETVTRNREHSDKEFEEVRRQVEEKMKGIERTNLTDNIQVVVNPNLLRGDADIKFYGDGRMHPIVFLKQLIERIEETGENQDYRKIVRRTLKGKLKYGSTSLKKDATLGKIFNNNLPNITGEIRPKARYGKDYIYR